MRSYKRTSTVQQESLSNILNGTKYQLSAPVTKPDLPLVPRDNTTDQNTTNTITSGGVVQVNNTIAHTSTERHEKDTVRSVTSARLPPDSDAGYY